VVDGRMVFVESRIRRSCKPWAGLHIRHTSTDGRVVDGGNFWRSVPFTCPGWGGPLLRRDVSMVDVGRQAWVWAPRLNNGEIMYIRTPSMLGATRGSPPKSIRRGSALGDRMFSVLPYVWTSELHRINSRARMERHRIDPIATVKKIAAPPKSRPPSKALSPDVDEGAGRMVTSREVAKAARRMRAPFHEERRQAANDPYEDRGLHLHRVR